MTALAATFRTAIRDAFANRGSFWVQACAMMVNDAAWVGFWLLFFRRVPHVRGWDAHRVLLLFAILTFASGLSLGLLGNARRIGRMAAEGEFDAVLTLPMPALGYVLARRVDSALLGDLAFGPVLFVIAGNPTPSRIALFIVGGLCGAAVLTGFLVLLGSLTFFVGGRGEHADLGFQAILLLASYPLDVFGGPTKVVLYTVVPAAFVSGLPTHLVDGFSPGLAAAMLAVAAGSCLAAATLFRLGLRRYTSGAVFTRA